MASADALPARAQRIFPSPLRYGAVAIVAAVLWINVYKTLWVGIQGWGRPYWWLDYHHGFVRRGLVGEVFQAIFGRLSENQLIIPVGWEHRSCLLVLGVVMLIQLEAALRAQVDPRRIALVLAVAIWAAVSQFWPTVAYTQGYLDSLVLALTAVAAMLMRARLYWAVGVCLAVGPFIHEYFCFLVPFVLSCDRISDAELEAGASGTLVGLDIERPNDRVGSYLLWLAGVAVLAAAAVIFLPAAAATRLEIEAMPMDAQARSVLSKVTLTQTLQQSLSACLSQFFQNPAYTLKNIVFFTGPGLFATATLLLWTGARPNWAMWMRAAAALFPMAALALAWDLSRLLVMADFTAVILFLMTAQDLAPPGREDRPGISWAAFLGVGAASLLALGYLVLPMAYVYYEPAIPTLFPLTSRLGLPPHIFGLRAIWPVANVTEVTQSLPADQKRPGPQLLHDLLPVPSVGGPDFAGWRIEAQPAERLALYGPYIDLKEGRYGVNYHLRVEQPVAACPVVEGRIEGNAMGEGKPLTSPTRLVRASGCSWTLSAELTVLRGGSTAVQTLLFLKTGGPMIVDRYDLEPVAAQSR